MPRWSHASLLAALFAAGCARSSAEAPALSSSSPPSAPAPAVSAALVDRCSARIAGALATPSGPGAPAFDAARAEFLGRARGEPMVFVREPQPDEGLPAALAGSARLLREGAPGRRVAQVIARHKHDLEAMRRLLLREGYLYAPDPHDALVLTTELHVGDLFDAPDVWQQRGAAISRLSLRRVRGARSYVHAEGERKGRAAELIFGDRLALSPEGLAAPLHRDLRALAESEGFDRTRLVHRGEQALVAELRFGDQWVRALLPSTGAALSLGCLGAGGEQAALMQARTRPRRQALARLSEAVTAQVDEALRFDRPEDEKTAERDGQLRPVWRSAYQRGADQFEVDGHTYPVYDASGQPWPPQVCVDFVLDSFERASGTWFLPRGQAPARRIGGLDLDVYGIPNRRGVLAFESFAASRPDLFTTRRFQGAERITFEHRAAFFSFLVEHADEFQPGDVLAIQGRKRDGLIHQHAILLERTDPVSGFPYGLADQMKRPRRRTFEGIMAEAPLRSLLYRIRPAGTLLGLETSL